MNIGRVIVMISFILLYTCNVFSEIKSDIMKLDEIKIGMKGICKTVFVGYKVEDFEIEVIGIIENIFPKKSIILIKCKGEKIKESGVAAGMSGSPVYLNGKLVGALAYSWGFPKEAIAGVTPIVDMLDVDEESGESPKKDSPRPNKLGTPDIPLKPLSGLLLVGGFDELLFEELKKELKKFDFLVQQFAGRNISEKNEQKLEPGGAVGVNLVSGDLDVSAVGTLTYIEDKKIFAFGHRMLNLGDTDLPLTSAYIYGIFPSYEHSFKLGATTKEIGRITFDRESGIVGEIGKFAKLIPLKVELINENKKSSTTYNFQVIKNKILSGKLIALVIANTIGSFSKSMGESTLELNLNIKIKSLPEVKFKDTYYSSMTPQMVVLQNILPVLETLADNDFSEIEFEEISAKMNLHSRKKVAEIQNIYPSKNKVKPGEKLNINVTLRKFGTGTETISIPVTIPFDILEGFLSIVVCDGLTSNMIDSTRISREVGFGSRQIGLPLKTKPASLKHLIELIEKQEKNTDIIVKLFIPKRYGAYVEGEEMQSLPYSVFQIMKSSNNTKYREMFDTVYNYVYNTDVVITGNQRLNITVEKE